jgi:hypothetical protein
VLTFALWRHIKALAEGRARRWTLRHRLMTLKR